MGFCKKRRKDINFLVLTPTRNYEHRKKENGLIDVLVPRFTSKFAKKFFLKNLKSPYFRANLDEFGSYLWENIDGNRDVSTLIEIMKERFGSSIEPATERTLLFFYQLYKAGFINFLELKKE